MQTWSIIKRQFLNFHHFALFNFCQFRWSRFLAIFLFVFFFCYFCLILGLLKVGVVQKNSRYTLLPNDTAGCRDGSTEKPCFFAGDRRVNEQIALQALHTTFMRFHNLMAFRLLELNPNWNDEKIFEEARNVVASSLQHILFNVHKYNWLFSLKIIEYFVRSGSRFCWENRNKPARNWI